MIRSVVVVLLFLVLACSSCLQHEGPPLYAIVGASLADQSGRILQKDSIVLTHGSEIWLVGPRSGTPVPADADIIDGRGFDILPVGSLTLTAGVPADLDLRSRDGAVLRRMREGVWLKVSDAKGNSSD